MNLTNYGGRWNIGFASSEYFHFSKSITFEIHIASL